MATHSSILAQKLTWTEEPGGLHGVRRVIQELASKPPPPLYLKTNFFFFLIFISFLSIPRFTLF